MTCDFKIGGCPTCGRQSCVARECVHVPSNPSTDEPYFTVPQEGWGAGWSGGEPPAHKLNADQTVAVATDVFWNEDMTTCPRGAKVQLLGAGGVAVYGDYHGDPFWVGWCPLPKRRRKV